LPLSPDEGRRILGQLYDAKTCREENASYRDYVERDRALKEKAAMYEQLYRSVTKRPGLGCRILRVITAGIARCH
jgi:hypothetical protein